MNNDLFAVSSQRCDKEKQAAQAVATVSLSNFGSLADCTSSVDTFLNKNMVGNINHETSETPAKAVSHQVSS